MSVDFNNILQGSNTFPAMTYYNDGFKTWGMRQMLQRINISPAMRFYNKETKCYVSPIIPLPPQHTIRWLVEVIHQNSTFFLRPHACIHRSFYTHDPEFVVTRRIPTDAPLFPHNQERAKSPWQTAIWGEPYEKKDFSKMLATKI